VKEVVERAREWRLGALFGFHAAYGGANCDAHSGTSSRNAELWGNKENLERGR
jgi:aryl-phospho-beta-D-glucosidase BglC (GH1 family)